MLNGEEFEVPLPTGLEAFGGSVRARLSGAEGAPLVLAMGGISADRFVVARADGGPGWWAGLAGPGGPLDPARRRVLGFDFAADPSGRRAPSTRQQARVAAAVLDAAKAGRAHAVLGASYGGMVALALAETMPGQTGRIAVVSAPASPHPFATARRELQRRVVALGLEAGRGGDALAIARGMAMTSYRAPAEFVHRFAGGLPGEDARGLSDAGAYLAARGEAYRAAMAPERFLSLSAAIDRHRVDPAAIPVPALLVGCTSDGLVPPEQMEALAAAMPDARLHLIDCLWGHDMFLKETDTLAALLGPFLERA